MLIEQSLFNLPEILTGSGYAQQDYEGGIVAAFGQALLQELNGRNVPNPIASLSAEHLYRTNGFEAGNTTRYLRADIVVNLGSVKAGSKRLSAFGWRHCNWLEAKFFRVRSGTPPTTSNAGNLVADLLRLATLVPLQNSKKENPETRDDGSIVYPSLYSGRYLLHVYQGSPWSHLTETRNATKTSVAGTRKWMKPLLTPGEQRVEIDDLEKEGNTFLKPIGKRLSDCVLKLDVTNLVVKPVASTDKEKTGYWCVLTRLDAFTVDLADRQWAVKSNRTGEESEAGAYRSISDRVGECVHLTGKNGRTAEEEELGDDVMDLEEAE